MKYILFGANGQLAKEFIKKLDSKNLFSYSKDKVDITDEKTLKEVIDYVKPSVIINCAAYNNVDMAENDYNSAFKVNAESVLNMARYSSKYKTKIIHYSTDYVFGGKSDFIPYTEDDNPSPVNKYGLSKLEGEKLLKKNYDKFLIFRVSWLYGDGKNNFIYKFLKWAENRNEIKVSTDENSIPTPASLVADVTLETIEYDLHGLWHLTPSGFTSRYNWAKFISEKLNLKVKIIETTQSEFNLPARRPNFSALSNEKLRKELGIEFLSWDEYLNNYLDNFKRIEL